MSTDTNKAVLALSTIALVPTFYGAILPNLADVRSMADDRGHLAASEQYAAVVTGAVVLGAAAVTRSPEVAFAGLIALVAFSAAYHRARLVAP